MRTTLQIDDDVLNDARAIARADGTTVGAVISALARHSLEPVGVRHEAGFPVFDVPTDARAITADDVARALDDGE